MHATTTAVLPLTLRSAMSSVAFLWLELSSDSWRFIWSTKRSISPARFSAVATLGLSHSSSLPY